MGIHCAQSILLCCDLSELSATEEFPVFFLLSKKQAKTKSWYFLRGALSLRRLRNTTLDNPPKSYW